MNVTLPVLSLVGFGIAVFGLGLLIQSRICQQRFDRLIDALLAELLTYEIRRQT